MVNAENKVSEIVAKNIKAAHVFKKHGIDFCCGGGISIEKACQKNKVNLDQLLVELNGLDTTISSTQNYDSWSLDFLVDYIVNTHHSYVNESLGLIYSYAEKVAKVHGEHEPAVIQIFDLYKYISQDLAMHMKKEEMILFPFIKKMVKAEKGELVIEIEHFGSINNPIRMMEKEHETVGDWFKQIAILSKQYTAPEWACNTFKALYAKLDEFEQDLHLHIHLENNILHPKALQLEKALLANN
ncbi:MAG: iron-sulfur cluster repair di-iron protein [Bacteroidia bacterium]|nr:iron-sulfur cluster repair di-iron protein [Bacteroidia bacterium]